MKSDLLLLLLYSKGATGKEAESITGITRLTKLLFLLKEQVGIDDSFTFVAYKMGPFSSEVYAELDFLQNFPPEKPFLKTDKVTSSTTTLNPEHLQYLHDMLSEDEISIEQNEANTIYGLSDVGFKVAQKLWNKLSDSKKKQIEEIKSNFGSIPLSKLLKYVYDNYPEMTVNSEIKADVNRI